MPKTSYNLHPPFEGIKTFGLRFPGRDIHDQRQRRMNLIVFGLLLFQVLQTYLFGKNTCELLPLWFCWTISGKLDCIHRMLTITTNETSITIQIINAIICICYIWFKLIYIYILQIIYYKIFCISFVHVRFMFLFAYYALSFQWQKNNIRSATVVSNLDLRYKNCDET